MYNRDFIRKMNGIADHRNDTKVQLISCFQIIVLQVVVNVIITSLIQYNFLTLRILIFIAIKT